MEDWLKAGRAYAHPARGEDVVISGDPDRYLALLISFQCRLYLRTGIAGCYPECRNIYEFRDKLAAKVDLLTSDNRRWLDAHPELPKRAGKVLDAEKFDASFFGVHPRQGDAVDPMCRMLLEKCFECILDSGCNPQEFEGSRTGVFVGVWPTEFELFWFNGGVDAGVYPVTGCHRSMLAKRIAYALNLQGPTYVMDSGCSSSTFALDHAYRAIREGKCDRAIVAGAHLCVHPYVTLQFARFGVLSTDGACKSFDDAANGFARSEAICAIVVQKSRDAKRIYAHVKHTKVNADGYKEQGLTFPSGNAQRTLMSEVYLESQVDPTAVGFMEAHGTGTKAGDPTELGAISEVFLKSRNRPLFIGSTKSNTGHTESTSGLSSVSKIILGYEENRLLPNIHYKSPRQGITALSEGTLVPVTECIPWPDENGLVGINNFGFGGSNSHVLLKWNNRKKIVNKDNPYKDVAMLQCVSGRTIESVHTILEDIKKKWMNPDYMRLFHDIFGLEVIGHKYRGFVQISTENVTSQVTWHSGEVPKLVYNFCSMRQSWLDVIRELLILQPFAKCFKHVESIALSLGCHVEQGLNNNEKGCDCLIAICTQIAIAETLAEFGLTSDMRIGSEFSHLICAYLDKTLTLNEILKLAYELDINAKGSLKIKETLEACRCKSTRKFPKKCVIVNFGWQSTSSANTINLLPSEGSISNHFVSSLGKIYLAGFTLKLTPLYPHVSFPVSKGTPMISPLIKWDHKRDWFVSPYLNGRPKQWNKRRIVNICINMKDDVWKYLTHHVVDGRLLFPASGYLVLAWDALGIITGKIIANMRIVFENVRFLRNTPLPFAGMLSFTISIQEENGHFEIIEDNTTIVTGTIREQFAADMKLENVDVTPKSPEILNDLDIYTEFKLRGYFYRGLFAALKSVDLSLSNGVIEWSNNWITFLDCVMQLQLLQMDTRGLCVPVGIGRLQIDASILSALSKGRHVPVYAYKGLNITRSAGIELRGFRTSEVNRRKVANPLLEKYVFVPNDTQLPITVSVLAMMQLVFEIYPIPVVKIIEYWPLTNARQKLLCPLIHDAIRQIPLLDANLIVLGKDPSIDLGEYGIDVEDTPISCASDCYLIIADRCTVEGHDNQLSVFTKVLKPQGFLLINDDREDTVTLSNYSHLLKHQVSSSGYLHLYQKQKRHTERRYLKYEESGEFLTELKNMVSCGSGSLVLHTDQQSNGLLGLTLCLKKEPILPAIQCLIWNSSTGYSLDDSLCREQLDKGFTVNIFEGGRWGTYRHLPLNNISKMSIKVSHAFANILRPGDLSTLAWVQGSIRGNDIDAVQVHYASVNFRDVVTATGRLAIGSVSTNRLDQDSAQGFEYSGVDSTGRRVMGMLASGALATMIKPDPSLILPVPDQWTLEEAATIPIVYSTVMYAFFMRAGGLKSGQRILIHSGTGGVGQAAIAIALFYNCEVFVTVGTLEKKRYLRRRFPTLKRANIGNSRDTSFEQLILHVTNNEGVDIVLNSLSEGKLTASLRCLAVNGHHIEIGKFDMAEDNELETLLFQRGITFHGIILDEFFKQPPSTKHQLMAHLQRAINDGAVKPLERTLFQKEELEKAFRYMASGTHIGKILIQIREDGKSLRTDVFPAVPRFYCPVEKSCLVVGGLGGFGLEICDWLVLRGCRQLAITSRSGCRTGYQYYRINVWRKYGAKVTVFVEDFQTEESCRKVLVQLPNVHAIFNLAIVMGDGLLEMQTEDNLKAIINSKVTITRHLDALSRELCPLLKHFVLFSSISCGRGNVGQSMYGMANSIAERIIEQRNRENLPGLAIQWGEIADVGIVAQMAPEEQRRPVAGSSQQQIFSCLEVMDKYLAIGYSVVSSILVAKKRSVFGRAANVVDAIMNIMGLANLKTVSLHSELPVLGMDSMMAVEIKQTLERDFEIFMSAKDIRNLTFSSLQDLQDKTEIC